MGAQAENLQKPNAGGPSRHLFFSTSDYGSDETRTEPEKPQDTLEAEAGEEAPMLHKWAAQWL